MRFKARSPICGKQQLVSSCLSVRMEQLGSHWTDNHDIWYLWPSIENIYAENSSFVTIREEYRVLDMAAFVHLWQHLAEFFLEWEIFQTDL